MTNPSGCTICGGELRGRGSGSTQRVCSVGCRLDARRLRALRDELAEPEAWPGRHDFLRQRLAALEGTHSRWQAANR